MVFEVDTLKDVLDRLGTLDSRSLQLLVWADTAPNCKPIVRIIRVHFPSKLDNKMIREMMVAINKITWILAVIDEHNNIYKVKEAEEYAKKSCESGKDSRSKKRT